MVASTLLNLLTNICSFGDSFDRLHAVFVVKQIPVTLLPIFLWVICSKGYVIVDEVLIKLVNLKLFIYLFFKSIVIINFTSRYDFKCLIVKLLRLNSNLWMTINWYPCKLSYMGWDKLILFLWYADYLWSFYRIGLSPLLLPFFHRFV